MVIEPRASYRVQLHAGFDFDAAAGIVDYLSRLGVSHLYCSPCLQAAPGSLHGYDVVDPTTVNVELGGDAGRTRLSKALAERGLGQMLDIVPNHMSTASSNGWWSELLRLGPESPTASFFDVDWSPPEPRLQGRILLPILGDHVGRVVESGDLRLEGDILRYFDRVLPVRPGTESIQDLQTLLDHQHYRLARWKAGADDLNYRRFFDIDDLVCLRSEDATVFQATHELVLGWVAEGSLDGLRIDHPDGLRRPAQYLEWLRAAAPEAWIVVEKILEPGESLRPWPVDGTTGYDFGQRAGALFVEASNEAAFTALYGELTGEPVDYHAVVEAAKRQVLESVLHADVRRVTQRFIDVCETHPRWRDFTRPQLGAALEELVIAFDVYRSYVSEDGRSDAADVEVIVGAIERARTQRPELDGELFDFIRAILLGELDGERPGKPAAEARMQLQQLSGPAMAKGVEDTAFYRYLRFVALNEVGGAPDRFGLEDVNVFHAENQRIQSDWPRTMLGLSSHDSKRSEDVRARLYALSEIPERWSAAVREWMSRNDAHRQGTAHPDRRTEYLIYQTLVGAWPLSLDRAHAYLEKATREAKSQTSWTDPDEAYDEALVHFVEALYSDEDFVSEVEAIVDALREPGRVNSLAQKLLQLTSPGVPDLYQGSELWDLSLVDPDNRRPVDYALRQRLLGELPELSVEDVWERIDEGLPKLFLLTRALALRVERPEAFGRDGGYEPLTPSGAAADHAVAFCRGEQVVTVVPRRVIGLRESGGFGQTTVELPAGSWRSRLTEETWAGGSARVADLLGRFPVALLAKEPSG